MKKLIIKIILFTIAATIIIICFIWKSPTINYNSSISIHNSIYNNPHYSTKIISLDKTFEVNYVKSSDKNSFNPYFPSIRIATTEPHNAWIHIIYTDSNIEKYKIFIDTCPKKDIYPYYTKDQDFYDSPIWEYTLLVKPVTYWRGHVYAIKIDDNTKSIKVLGGIEWGYKLSYFYIRPQMILPSALNIENWENDKKIINGKLSDYKFVL